MCSSSKRSSRKRTDSSTKPLSALEELLPCTLSVEVRWWLPVAGTETVKILTHQVYGITVRIIDMPGLKPSASDARHNARILAQVRKPQAYPKPLPGKGHVLMQNSKRERPLSCVFQARVLVSH